MNIIHKSFNKTMASVICNVFFIFIVFIILLELNGLRQVKCLLFKYTALFYQMNN